MMAQARDLEGKTIVVTGATSGIGLATLGAMAARGAFVVGVGRSEMRCREAQQTILTAQPDARLAFCIADLASQQQVRDLAGEVEARLSSAGYGHLDALINNAGTVSSWFVATQDGYELQFAVNHLAPFLLTHELMGLLKCAPEGRVIVVSSGSHRRGRMHWNDVMLRRHYRILKAYKQSKLANVLFVSELNRRMGPASSVHAYAADPGLVNTEMGFKGTGGLARWVWQQRRTNGASPNEAAEALAFLATGPEVDVTQGIYWKAGQPVAPSRRAGHAGDARRLWELSSRLCGLSWLAETPSPARPSRATTMPDGEGAA